MEDKKIFKPDNIKIFIIPFVIITIAFIIISYATTSGIQSHFHQNIKNKSLNLAKIYSQNLATGTAAHDVINKLLEEKILTASQTVALIESPTNEELSELAEVFNVDEIDYYNPEGEIIYSNLPELIGWKTFENHPVYEFLHSSKICFIEDIRQDWVTGNYYKYGYFRTPAGGLVQIGIRADKILSFLNSFEMHHLLHKLSNASSDCQISFINNEFEIIDSTDQQLIGQKITDQNVLTAISSDTEYIKHSNYNGNDCYEIFTPIYLDGAKIGTLKVSQSLEDTITIMKHITFASIFTILISYISLLYTMISVNKKNKQLSYLAFYDSLTGLPNKHSLEQLLKKEIKNKGSDKKALMLINCRNFHTVNLTYGYEYGDEFLKKLSGKFTDLLDENKKLFRFSADRFVLYVKNYSDRQDLIDLVNKINQIFSCPFKIRDTEQILSAQIGIAELNRQDSVNHLLKVVSISLNSLNYNDQVNYAFFNFEMERKLHREDLLEKEIRTAIAHNDTNKLYLEYQPQFYLQTDKIRGFEALARFNSEHFGPVSPLEFINLAERKNLIIDLGLYLLAMACRFSFRLSEQGYENLKIAVNVSCIELLRNDYSDKVLEIIKQAGMDQTNLELEITESILSQKYALINKKLKKLRDNGIDIAIDDFGTGYSSLYRFDELNIDTLKIDKSFINKICLKNKDQMITGDIISIAHKFGIKVVAEGVENSAQKEYLKENHCDLIQGNLLSKPLSEEDVFKLLEIKYPQF